MAKLPVFLPALAFIEGARISEVKVNTSPPLRPAASTAIDRTFPGADGPA